MKIRHNNRDLFIDARHIYIKQDIAKILLDFIVMEVSLDDENKVLDDFEIDSRNKGLIRLMCNMLTDKDCKWYVTLMAELRDDDLNEDERNDQEQEAVLNYPKLGKWMHSIVEYLMKKKLLPEAS